MTSQFTCPPKKELVFFPGHTLKLKKIPRTIIEKEIELNAKKNKQFLQENVGARF